MTAIQWFANQLGITSGTMLEQAKEMERLQLADAQSYAISNADMTNNRGYFDCDKWYAETYGSDGSDEVEKSGKPINLTSSQTEISDEEIEKWVESTPYYGHCTPEYKEGLDEGAKWYREQLKSR